MIPGEMKVAAGEIDLNKGRRTVTLQVTNSGDRPIQVGSHYHFFETNEALRFERAKAYGFRLNIAAGTAVRFEPGDRKRVTLVAFAGTREVHGLNSLCNGALTEATREAAMTRALEQGFGNTEATGGAA